MRRLLTCLFLLESIGLYAGGFSEYCERSFSERMESLYCDGYYGKIGYAFSEDEPEVIDKDGYDFYLLDSYSDLYWFAEKINGGDVSASAMLGCDIVLNEIEFGENGTVLNEESLTQWIPIAYDKINSFSGIFDGCGYTIEGLYFSDEYASRAGLFGQISFGGTVKNLCLRDVYVKAYDTYGGIAAYNDGLIEGCSVEGTVVLTGDAYSFSTGAICGSNFGGTINNCHNSSSVYVTGTEYVGGISGDNYGYLEMCYNDGEIHSSRNIGGITGVTDYTSVESCYNLGFLFGGESSVVGGITSLLSYGTVLNCYNYGYIAGSEADSNPIVGNNMESVIESCFFRDGSVAGFSGDADIRLAESGSFASGMVAYTLQSYLESDVWGQVIGTDTVPVFYEDGNKVYKIELVNKGELLDIVYANSGNIGLPDLSDGENEFIGWFDAEDGGVEYTGDSALESDMTLYAQWNTSGISSLNSGVRFCMSDGVLHICGDYENVTVCSVAGNVVYMGTDSVIPLQSGAYIVNIDGEVFKAVVD